MNLLKLFLLVFKDLTTTATNENEQNRRQERTTVIIFLLSKSEPKVIINYESISYGEPGT